MCGTTALWIRVRRCISDYVGRGMSPPGIAGYMDVFALGAKWCCQYASRSPLARTARRFGAVEGGEHRWCPMLTVHTV